MADIMCVTLSPVLESNVYPTPKGNSYRFFFRQSTEIKDKEDIEFFLKAGGGKLFIRTDTVGKVKSKVKEVVTGKKQPKVPKIKVHTKEELIGMLKREQIELIQKLAGSHHKIPRYEKDRVELIMKLEKEMSNIKTGGIK